jgi:hypothetical protein
MNPRNIYLELTELGYSDEQALQIFQFMENLPIENLSKQKDLYIKIIKGHILILD